jgi:hypothetical protein
MPEVAGAVSGKDTLVFHCALSQVKIQAPTPSLLVPCGHVVHLTENQTCGGNLAENHWLLIL